MASADRLLAVQSSLTARDYLLIGWLYDHGVLTIEQIAHALFPSLDFTQRRLPRLIRLGVIDRFRPQKPDGGSFPYHYVIDQLGADVVAAQRGEPRPRRDHARNRRHHLTSRANLPHLLGTNQFFVDLAGYARTHPQAELVRWWPAARFHNAGAFYEKGDDPQVMARPNSLPRPDAHGVWRENGSESGFWLEFDLGTEDLGMLMDKVYRYLDLSLFVKRRWPVLFSLPASRRERNLHQRIAEALSGLGRRLPAPAVATLARDHTTSAGLGPAEAVWWLHGPPSGSPIPDLAEPPAARTWLQAERFNLVAVVAHAAVQGNARYAVGLCRTLHRYLSDCHLTEMVAINTHALEAARRAGDIAGQGHALRSLSTAISRLSRYHEGLEYAEQSLARFRQAGDQVGEALALTNIGVCNYRLGYYKLAVADQQQALALAPEAGDRFGEGFVLNNLAVVEERLGNCPAAADYNRQAIAIFRELGSRYCEAITLNNLANAELRMGEYESAADHLWQSLATIKPFGTPITEAHTYDSLGILHVRLGEPATATEHFGTALTIYRHRGRDRRAAPGARAHAGLGHAHRALGDPDQARSHYEQAYARYTEMGMPAAEDVRRCLTAVGPAPAER